jgi:ribosomal protein L21E
VAVTSSSRARRSRSERATSYRSRSSPTRLPPDLLFPDKTGTGAFHKKGYIPLTTYLRTYKVGEHVDVKVNGAVHKGMPHKFYHGRTGRVWDVTKRAISVEINKQVLPR